MSRSGAKHKHRRDHTYQSEGTQLDEPRDRQPRGAVHAAQSTGLPEPQTLCRQANHPRWAQDDFDTDPEVITSLNHSVPRASCSMLPRTRCLLLPAMLKHVDPSALFVSGCREPALARVALQGRPPFGVNAPSASFAMLAAVKPAH